MVVDAAGGAFNVGAGVGVMVGAGVGVIVGAGVGAVVGANVGANVGAGVAAVVGAGVVGVGDGPVVTQSFQPFLASDLSANHLISSVGVKVCGECVLSPWYLLPLTMRKS